MHWMSSAAALVAIALATPADSSAQTVPDLSGTWVLQVDKSDFGPMAAPDSRTDVITHNEPNLTIKRSVKSSATGETVSDLVYAVDGKPYKNKAGPTELTSTLKWEGATLVVTSTVETPNGPVTITDRMTLSADGKTMTQLRTLSAQGQEATQTMVLVKQ